MDNRAVITALRDALQAGANSLERSLTQGQKGQETGSPAPSGVPVVRCPNEACGAPVPLPQTGPQLFCFKCRTMFFPPEKDGS